MATFGIFELYVVVSFSKNTSMNANVMKRSLLVYLVVLGIVFLGWTTYKSPARNSEPPCSKVHVDMRGAGNELHVSKDGRVICGASDCPFRSQSGEDRLIIQHMMQDARRKSADLTRFPYAGPNYLVVEIGGYDGVTFSNSFFFETFLGWRAVHWEASRNNYPQLVRNRPYATNLHLAVCEDEGKVTFVESSEGLVSGVEDSMTNRTGIAVTKISDTKSRVVP